ncbi:hypothetical protein [Thermobaculum terrenum]|uniref:hypothetical protein n=1 Tax=Thermobaculum terrenum TaxID=166501 RepID=UPI00019BF16D|nr:hypothetical protein [Thermobaculum terrenum]
MPDEERLSWESSKDHPSGVRKITRLSILVRNGALRQMLEEYGEGPVGLTLATPSRLVQLKEFPERVER